MSDLPLNTLWSNADCAMFFRRNTEVFVRDIASHPDFPKPIELPTGKGRKGHPLYEPQEVIAFARSFKRAA
jgi:hypothetical protein